MTGLRKPAALALLMLLGSAGCAGDPTGSKRCEYGVYPPTGVQMHPDQVRYVESFSNCATEDEIELLEVTGWSSSNAAVVDVTPLAGFNRGADLHANAAGTATITATYGGGKSALLEVVVQP